MKYLSFSGINFAWIKKRRVALLLGVLIIFFNILLFSRHSVSYNLLENVEYSDASPLTEFVSIDQNAIYYCADENPKTPVDFNEIQNAITCPIGHLDYGVYELFVEYSSEYSNAYANSPITNITISGKNSDQLGCDTLELYEYKSFGETPIWVMSLFGTDEVVMNINFSGYGKSEIRSIYLKEHSLWKIGIMLLSIVIYMSICLYYYKLKRADISVRLKWLSFAVLIIFTSLPAFNGGQRVFVGHDYFYHTDRIASIAAEIKYGHLPVLYQSDANNGFGYIAMLLYGNIFLYIPAVMHLLGMPLSVSYEIFLILVNVVTCGITYYSLHGMFKEYRYAFCGTVLYMLAAYRLTDVYVRSAVGEYTAMAFFPLVIYGFYRIYISDEENKIKNILPVTLGVSGVIESHILSVEILAVFIILFVFVHIKDTLKKLVVLLEALVSIILLNLFFIVPFMDAYKQELRVNTKVFSENLLRTGTYFHQIFSMFLSHAGRSVDYGVKEEMPLSIGFPFVLGIFLFIIVMICKDKWELDTGEKRVYCLVKECFIYGLLSLFLSSVYFPWQDFAGSESKLIKLFTCIQFAWRYLSVATIFFTIVTVYAIKMVMEKGIPGIDKNILSKVSFVIIATNIIVSGEFFSGYINSTDTVRNLSSSCSLHADVLYVPSGASMSSCYADISVHTEPEMDVRVKKTTTESNKKIFEIDHIQQDCLLTLPIFNYDYLTVVDENGNYYEKEFGYNRQLAIRVNQGYSGKIIVDYHMRYRWKAAYLISFIYGTFVLAILVKNKTTLLLGSSDKSI